MNTIHGRNSLNSCVLVFMKIFIEQLCTQKSFDCCVLEWCSIEKNIYVIAIKPTVTGCTKVCTHITNVAITYKLTQTNKQQYCFLVYSESHTTNYSFQYFLLLALAQIVFAFPEYNDCVSLTSRLNCNYLCVWIIWIGLTFNLQPVIILF